jgi:hypothetical protein
MHERVRDEIALVRNRYADVEHGPNLEWILVPMFPTPPGRFNKETTKVMFVIPAGYPQTGPDDFFVDGDLRLVGGSTPPGFNQGPNSSSGPAPIPGDWGWFSWHPKDWRPAARVEDGDNLLTFLRGVTACLEGREET